MAETGQREGSGSGGDRTLTNAGPVSPGGPGASSAVKATFAPGQLVAGRYEVEHFLARGGMGEVYRVHDRELGESVALKTILPRSAGDPVSLDRFRREIQIARKVSHRNVCRIFDLGRHVADDGGEVVFLTMELLAGVSLRARLRESVLTPAEAVDVVTQLAAGLGAAHRSGIVHRDLKPSNVFLVPEGEGTRVVIADFGLARTQLKEDGQLTVTGTGEILGTPAYMAPEQLEGKPATTASDIYAFGLVMYEMLTGAQPFEGDSAFQIALNKLRDEPTSPSTRVRGLPALWDRIILRCLEKDPADRFAKVDEISEVLSGERRLRGPSRRSSRRRIALGAAVVVALVGLAIGLRWWDRGPGAGRGDAVELRRSVAVLGFENITGDPETAWLSVALGDFLTTELGLGGAVRAVPSESVAQARAELGIDQVATLGPETLGRLRELLAVDLVVLGSYAVLGAGPDARVRLDTRVQESVAGEITILPPVSGRPDELGEIALGAATEIRRRFGIDVAGEAQASGVLPTDPEAARLYAEGVAALRSYDPQEARLKLERAAAAAPGSALVWHELADALARTGRGIEAIAAAKRARELSGDLDRELRLRIEGQYQSLAGSYDEAIDTYRSLWLVYPDSLEYGLRLAETQAIAGMADDALATIGELRALPAPISDDPRIDLAEAYAAGAIGDPQRQAEVAGRVVESSRRLGSGQLEAEARLALGSALRELGELDRSLAELQAARSIEVEAGNPAGEARAAYSLARTLLAMGDVEAGMREAEAALALARPVEARPTEGDALNLIGSIRVHQGDFPGAVAALEEALALQRAIRNASGVADALNNLALVQMWAGDFSGSVDHFGEALALFRELGKPASEAAVLMNLARIDGARGDLDGARSRFEEAAGLYRAQSEPVALAEALFGLAEVLLTRGDLQGARTRHEEALRLRRERGLDSAVESEFALAGLTLAEASLGRARYADAVAALDRSVAAFAQANRPALEADALNYLVEALLGAGEVERAEAALGRLEALDPAANSVTRMVSRISGARVAAARGQVETAERALDRVVDDARVEASLGVELEAKLAMAEVLAGSGRPEEARRRLDEIRREAVARGWMLVADKAEVRAREL
ncbi:MAG: protein kinase [Thermoanaerobaculales bacterium]|nr:protein kinase [Thermoanaerobaculales bacterium]